MSTSKGTSDAESVAESRIINVRAATNMIDWSPFLPLIIVALAFGPAFITFRQFGISPISLRMAIIIGASCTAAAILFALHRIRSLADRLVLLAKKHTNAAVEDLIAILSEKVPASAGRRTRESLMRLLTGRGLTGATVIIRSELPAQQPPPALTVPFEPIPVDEANPAFRDLEAACNAPGEPFGPGDDDAADSLFRRRVARTLVYTGVWIGLVIFGVNFIAAIIKCAAQKRWDADVLLHGAGLLLFLGVPFVRHYFGSPPWLLVPGGLVRRAAGRGAATSEVNLFVRANSILIIRPIGTGLWRFIVSDGWHCGSAQVSLKEKDLLLRAWLSPLPPPDAEKLVDLT